MGGGDPATRSRAVVNTMLRGSTFGLSPEIPWEMLRMGVA